jgi:terminase, large subunit
MQTITYHIKNSTWFPASLLETMKQNGGKLTYETGFTRPERKIMRRKKPIKPSVWSERHRVLTMSSLPGPWKNRVTQYLVGIMDAMGYPSVREVDVCKSPQTGVSEAAHNFVGWCIDRNPGPVLYCYPDELTARENSKDRVLPMIKSSAKLRSYMTSVLDDQSILRVNMQHMPIYFAWATSPSRLGNKPIKIAIADEVDKYPSTLNKEAGSLSLLDKRLNTYRRNSKIIRISTPTVETGNIWTGYQSCPAKFDYYVKCPQCGASQKMTFEQIKWPKDKRDPEEVREKKLAWYECEQCKAEWNDSLRDEAVLHGDWLTKSEPRLNLDTYLDTFKPNRVAFHLPAYISPFVSFPKFPPPFLGAYSETVTRPGKAQGFLQQL